MARILIVESHPEVRELLERVIGRLGHDAVAGRPDAADLGGFDVCVLEPAAAGEAAVRALAAAGLPTVCVSISPPSHEVERLEPVAFLLKPFSLADLEQALGDALGRVARAGS